MDEKEETPSWKYLLLFGIFAIAIVFIWNGSGIDTKATPSIKPTTIPTFIPTLAIIPTTTPTPAPIPTIVLTPTPIVNYTNNTPTARWGYKNIYNMYYGENKGQVPKLTMIISDGIGVDKKPPSPVIPIITPTILPSPSPSPTCTISPTPTLCPTRFPDENNPTMIPCDRICDTTGHRDEWHCWNENG